jgi:hypothetical protein
MGRQAKRPTDGERPVSGILFSFTAVQWPVRVHWTSGIALMLAATSGGVPLSNPAAVLIWAGVITSVVLTSDLVSARLAHLAGARTEAIVLSGVGGELIFAGGAGLGPLVHLGGPAVALLTATFAELVAQVLRHQLPVGGIWMLERWAAASLFWGLFTARSPAPLAKRRRRR